MTQSPSSRSDLYAQVTDEIVAAIEAGASTFDLPWRQVPGLPLNLVSQRSYRGVNTLLLWLTSHVRGYATPYWATFRQWRGLGHAVRKGEPSATVVFWKTLDASRDDETSDAHPEGDREDRREGRPVVARAYHVFNAAQVEGFTPPELAELSEEARMAEVERFFEGLPIPVLHDAEGTYCQPSGDCVHLPPFSRFRDAAAYYAVRGHECVHATGAKTRLDRDLTGRFGSQAYAMEELVAELGAAFVCAQLGIASERRDDHAGYLASWLQVLKSDSRAIFTVAGKAQAAADWLLEHSPPD